MARFDPASLPDDRPVLIAGPTASGKSALALAIAEAGGGVIINADAMQVYRGWPILSAQPPAEDRARAPHALYGHLPHDAQYSVGAWLAELAPLLRSGARPIITGGTGLYFTALTEGLSDIPPIPGEIRSQGDGLALETLLAQTDPKTLAGLDQANRARVQRAWEVERATGKPLRHWQGKRQPPLLPRTSCTALRLTAPRDWLTPRIARRFDLMLEAGALAEAEAMRPHWNPAHLSARTIGAREMIAYLAGQRSLDSVRESVIIASRQYAKRQRTWLRARMSGWHALDPQDLE